MNLAHLQWWWHVTSQACPLRVFVQALMPIFPAHRNLVPSRTDSKANDSTRPFQTPQNNTALFLLSTPMALKLQHTCFSVFFFLTRFAIIQINFALVCNSFAFNLPIHFSHVFILYFLRFLGTLRENTLNFILSSPPHVLVNVRHST